MNFIIIFFGLLFYLHYLTSPCYSKYMTFLDVERPVVDWFDKKYCKNVTMICRRVSRQDPRHYLDIHIQTLATANNNLMVDFYFHQFLSNRYQPSFIELHLNFCEMLEHDMFLGIPLRIALRRGVCPLPPGEYHILNMTIPFVPKGFPFTKGRIYCNVSLNLNGAPEVIGGGWADTELKVVQIKNK